jgi:hypothetical protein
MKAYSVDSLIDPIFDDRPEISFCCLPEAASNGWIHKPMPIIPVQTLAIK